jgi:hypothetical protein
LRPEQESQNKELCTGKIKYPGKKRQPEMSKGEVIAAEYQKDDDEQGKSNFHYETLSTSFIRLQRDFSAKKNLGASPRLPLQARPPAEQGEAAWGTSGQAQLE